MTTTASTTMPNARERPVAPPSAGDFLDVDRLLSDEERMIRDTVRQFVRQDLLDRLPEAYADGHLPDGLPEAAGRLGLLGMHLHGYGCPGTSAVAYGLACLELEAGDSGIRSFVSVQGSLAMYALLRYGSEAQKRTWLPGMAAGNRIGCFGLNEPDAGSDPSNMRTTARFEDGHWVLSGTKMWITNGGIADIAIVWAKTGDGIRGFVAPRGTDGLSARDIQGKLSLRASTTSELVLAHCRLPEDALLPHARAWEPPGRTAANVTGLI
ncbi:hypothetical protein Psi02_76370 [Planotetraspora silvatica]|uniref:Acyl-CoA dehydrogenase n=1 Tax=Planotetraspora silvatica TaxID=234614 RepID=A0A8J3XW26_9ACTN|nr:hypothetical protein Psi02_76370 [Planotetraspora silvatica]